MIPALRLSRENREAGQPGDGAGRVVVPPAVRSRICEALIIFPRQLDRRTLDAGTPRHSSHQSHGRDPMPRIPYKDLMQSDEMAEKLEMSTAEIGLSVRTTNCLEERGIFTVHDLLNCTRADLLSISNFGEKTLEEVYKALEKIGFFRTANPGDGDACRPVSTAP
jgi:DNA-directed RNA polymerase subunit alpha